LALAPITPIAKPNRYSYIFWTILDDSEQTHKIGTDAPYFNFLANQIILCRVVDRTSLTLRELHEGLWVALAA